MSTSGGRGIVAAASFGTDDAGAPPVGNAVRPPGPALIVVKRGPGAGSRFVLDQAVSSAGRHPNSDLFLDDVTASRRHVEFRRENSEFVIVDVGSLNGTYVNRKLVQSAILHDGDEIQIGKFRLIFLAEPPGRKPDEF